MGVASIPDHKDQRACDEWNALRSTGKMDEAKDATDDFVTVVSVGSQPTSENFVTVLSIGSGKKDDEQQTAPTALDKVQANGVDGHLEEEVEVFRLPGERLGFGLKFEGGNKTSERVRRLFVQSCAEQSPASRAKCSWGTLGEGDEVLSIDGVPVTHMTRLDCVRRLKESQLVIRLMVRCRGALRPEVVSAERKSTLSTPERSKVPPELPAAPPPVPPRKLRQTRGLADGEANPSPAKKSWDSPAKSQNGSPRSKNGSPKSQASSPKLPATQLLSCSNKTTPYESCESSPRVVNGPSQESPKGSPPERSPELSKSKEPPEAMVYLDARSQCGSTHGSTSDDTGSSLSTVVDRFSTSDRVSTISTASTASTTSEQQLNGDHESTPSTDHDLQLSRAVCPLEHLEREFQVNQPDYLLRRLANSEAVTHVESRGEVERITAVVAPNTVLIEETITLQPPLSFQDAPLSYGHETRPDLFYSADLAADSTTHFRPIKDDAELVERVNGDREESADPAAVPAERTNDAKRPDADRTPPPLPARNHVNRIPVNQQLTSDAPKSEDSSVETHKENAPVLPPKPLPRKDVKIRRKRPPPPPPPPTIAPRRETRPPVDSAANTSNETHQQDNLQASATMKVGEAANEESRADAKISTPRLARDVEVDVSSSGKREGENDGDDDSVLGECHELEGTNKVLEIIEIRKAKALTPPRFGTPTVDRKENASDVNDHARAEVNEDVKSETAIVNGERLSVKDTATVNATPTKEASDSLKNRPYTNDNDFIDDITKDDRLPESSVSDDDDDDSDSYKEALSKREDTFTNENSIQQDGEDDETYKSLDEINDDLKITDVNGIISDDEIMDDDESTTDESDDGDYYWQSNLATIGEEEETNSLEYTTANKDANDAEPETVESSEPQLSPTSKMNAFTESAGDDAVDSVNGIADYSEEEDKKSIKETVNGRMENCGGGQRLPPDGDEFPASYQEFSSNNSQQYQRFAATTRASTMTTNGGNVVEGEAFVGNDSFKMLASDSNVVGSRSILLPDNNRIVVPSVEGIRQEALLAPQESRRTDEKVPYQAPEDVSKRNSTAVSSYSTYCSQTAGNGNILLSEKKIEIAGYYHKEVPAIEKEAPNHSEKETSVETPPPLPLTGPPKMDAVNLHGKSVPPPADPPPRKFSLNSELWRQDDKSERSVRDKIAMFSSQSSLETPLFPSPVTVATVTTNGRRLSKYKSTEDMCADEKGVGQKEKVSFFADRTQSSFDLTDSARSFTPETRKYGPRSPSLSKFDVSPANSSTSVAHTKQLPPVPQKASSVINAPPVTYETKQNFVAKPYSSPSSPIASVASQQNGNVGGGVVKNYNSLGVTNSVTKSPTSTVLTRATSFSGSTPYVQEKTSPINEPTSPQVSRTNSLASTFRKPNEDMRRASLNQLIEQRRRSISKLRGLVIPEKETVSIDQPIVDLPEIKSRDSILLHQMPKANIQDKWGSQSSLASTTSTASMPLKATTSFKMPAPQINSKYSPAFKRKSLTVYGTSAGSTATINGGGTTAKDVQQTSTTLSATTPATNLASEPPKSLESICSPTRSDYSFEFLSTTSSPDTLGTRSRTIQRKTRMDYDDSDNDSAVSSSQSSISRGFSPPMSPVPSERSTVSSERSYVSTETNYQRRSIIADSPTNRAFTRDSVTAERDQYTSRPSIPGDRSYVNSERSSSSSSGSNPRSPQPNESLSNLRNSQIPQRQTLRRSNSTDTNCSTSSTLTSGSQASAESLSRRVLKPQSVEAINRKNILASARCRSGRDLNGSPLIQRKFSDDEETPVTSTENGTLAHHQQITNNNGNNGLTEKQDVKIAYIEVTDSFLDQGDNSYRKKIEEEPKLPPKRSTPPVPAVRPPKSEMLEPSNDLKMWVRAEAKALIRSTKENSSVKYEQTASFSQEIKVTNKIQASRNGRTADTAEDEVGNLSDTGKSRTNENELNSNCPDVTSSRSRAIVSSKKPSDDQNDLLTILTTRSRSRSAIHVDDGTFGKSKSQMSLEDILGAKADAKPLRSQGIESKTKNGTAPVPPPKPGTEARHVHVAKKSSPAEAWTDEKPFVSKIPTLGRTRVADTTDETSESDKSRSTVSKIPTVRSLGRRSASVTDMKKALEKVDSTSPSGQHQASSGSHSRFPSLDSSVDESVCPIGTEVDADRCCGEQFGSISSLASSTSLISQQELAQLVEEASLEEARGAHDVIVVLLHKENPTGSVGITLAGGADCEVKEITVHRVLAHSIADKDGRVQRGDRILSINGRSTRGLTHRESLAVLKQPRSEVVLVVSRARVEEGCNLRSRTASVETIVEGFETNGVEDTAWGPPANVLVYKDGAGLGFSLEGGRDSPLGDRPLVIKKIFTGGAAEKTGALKAGDQLLEVNGSDVTRMSRIEAWSLMKKLHDGEVNLLVRHPATKSS